ncbi:MAG: NAD-dependent succinate-semialdehyde dehydrogenase [Lysobacteraceae bacterium]|nr:MAG: NAD-dependent succinate-semialdehyde dehydrogenase [Xanthomonadaceae bacterium]
MNTLKSYNPADGSLVGEVPTASAEDVVAAVSRARAAAKDWRAMAPQERADLLKQAGEVLLEKAGELGALLTQEMGKPSREAVGEVKSCGRGMASETEEIIAALEPEQINDGNVVSTQYFEPLGVCAAITPWNFPISMPHWLVLPALMTGNTVVLKPSEETPLIAQAYVDVLNQFLPHGVLNIIHGADDQGKQLVAADVDLIAFTGSRDTGAKILAAASGSLKRVILELGGKDPLVVLEDANLEHAAKFAVQNSFRNAGQVCVSTERVYVAESIADEFEKLMARNAAEMRVGPGDQDGVKVGPMINEQQRSHVLKQLHDAVARGARVVAGGGEHADRFVNPTVLAEVDNEADIMRAETFGPVVCVNRFASDQEAIALANDTEFGLGAAVFGEPEHAENVARQIEAGMVGVNQGCFGASGTPWVGAKQSGYGFHSSKDGHRQFTQRRVVSKRAG